MALTRRRFLFSIPLGVAALWGCAKKGSDAGAKSVVRELDSSGKGRTDRPSILVFMPDTVPTREVWKGLSDELGSDYTLLAYRIDGAFEGAEMAKAMARYRPRGIVLMNNPTVASYRQYQAQNPTFEFPPAVVVMSSFLEGQIESLKSVSGVAYEVPLITAMTNLRRILVLPAERVGVVVREPLRGFVAKQVTLALREQVVVEEEVVSGEPNSSEIKSAVRRLKERVNVLWILNDDHLLTPSLIAEAWLPALDERPWCPSIVGVSSLVSAKTSFGTFAVLPDHVALGAQAGSLMVDIADNEWKIPTGERVQLPLSVMTTIDLVQAKERFELRPEATQQVDRILE